MADFFAVTVAVSTTAAKVVDSANHDRLVLYGASGTLTKAGFTSSVTVTNGYRVGSNSFVLAAGQELWLIASADTTIDLLVTSIGR